MFKSLFSKFLTIYVAIILGGFLLLAVGLSGVIENYFMNQKEQLLMDEAKIIRDQYALAYYTGIMDTRTLNVQLELLDKYLNARIWFVDTKGQIYIESSSANKQWNGQKISIDAINKVLNGEIITIKGKFGGLFAEPVLTVGYPIVIDYKVQGAMFMHAPIPDIQKTVSDVYRMIISCLLISLLLAFFLIYILSRKIIKPLKKMNNVAKEIAGGDFGQRLDIESEDEVGELAESLNYMAGELNKLEELRKSFIANISHDFRSPLTSIKGFIQAILDGTIPAEKQDKYLHIVLDESHRLTKLTNDILDLTNMESGEVNLEKQHFDIHELIRQVIIPLERRIIEKNINLELIFVKDRLIVHGDPEKITRVIYNLIDNAIKFISEGDKIIIETSLEQSKVKITIKDTGPGISTEHIKYIWDRFHKADRSRGKDKKGTGLGLSIVKQILKHHGEDIEVESKEGEGTTFIFSLPLGEKSSKE